MAYDDDPEGHGLELRDDYDLGTHAACTACLGRFTADDPAVPVCLGSVGDVYHVHRSCKAWTLRSVGR